jgi:hypothetical protein
MMQIVPVGSQARRAAAVARVFSPLAWLVGSSVLALGVALGVRRRQRGG